MYMLRDATHKYVNHVGDPPQLFDLTADPNETRDLAADPRSAPLLGRFERHLGTIVDPEAVDRAAKADQARRIEAGGGLAVINKRGPIAGGTPPPTSSESPKQAP